MDLVTKEVTSGEINKNPSMITEDVCLKWLIATTPNQSQEITSDQHIVKNFLATLVCGELHRTMSVGSGIKEGTFTH